MFTISIDDARIKAAFDCFLVRMDSRVLASFEGLLTEVKLVDKIIHNARAAGGCYYSMVITGDIVTLEFSRCYCDPLSHEGLIGLFAHEFGHVEDRLLNGNCAELYDEDDEDAEVTANTNGCYWGFRQEIYQMYKELGSSDKQIPIDEAAIDDESISSYWASVSLRTQYL